MIRSMKIAYSTHIQVPKPIMPMPTNGDRLKLGSIPTEILT